MSQYLFRAYLSRSIPSTNLQASRTKKAPRKKTIMVKVAIESSALGRYQRAVAVGSGIPKADRPSALRMISSKWSRAAFVATDDSTESEVAVEVIGIGGDT